MCNVGKLFFVGLGLNSDVGISLQGLQAAREADSVFVEFYTNLMPKFSLDSLEKIIGKPLKELNRNDLEELPHNNVLAAAKIGTSVLLVPGDPMTATTHMDLRLRAHRNGIETFVIHGASIITAAIGACGLQVYKFGRAVTIPIPEPNYAPDTPYLVFVENQERGLHTLFLLDVKAHEGKFLSVREGLNYLLSVQEEKNLNHLTNGTLSIGVARVGGESQIVRAGSVDFLRSVDLGGPPQVLIIPGKLHFMEEEGLTAFANWLRQ